MEPSSYFITEHQSDAFSKKRQEEFTRIDRIGKDQLNARMHGTVGAVALDRDGNVAAGTSTGGTENKKMGRIGDSCIIGVGCYTKNKTCAISGTRDGELLIKNVVAYDISALMEYKDISLQKACETVVLERMDSKEGDVGVIGVDLQGNIALVFNSERMHRGWKTNSRESGVEKYQKKQK